MKAMRCRSAIYGLSMIGWIAAVFPVAAETLSEGFRKCSTCQDRDARLDCFDAEVARLLNAQTQNAQMSNARMANVSAGSDRNFGVTGSVLAQQQAKQNTQPTEVTARVTEVSTRPRGELVITLDNGQIWQQTQAGTNVRVRADDVVTIRAGALSSYILIAASGKTTKVTRIR